MPELKMLENALKPKKRQRFMPESTLMRIGMKLGQTGLKKAIILVLESTIFSKLAGCQWVKQI